MLLPLTENWLVLSDEQMSKTLPFSLLNDEQMSNWVGVENQPEKHQQHQNQSYQPLEGSICKHWLRFCYIFVGNCLAILLGGMSTLPETNIAPKNDGFQ